MDLPFKVTGKHRSFQVKGDSMPPLKHGAIMIGSSMRSLADVKDGETYIVLTKDGETVYKRLYRDKNKLNNVFEFHSDNPLYAPYTVQCENIAEIWSFVCSLHMEDFNPEQHNIENVIRFLRSYSVELCK
ncbi:MAG: family transcriptional regulator [Bacteroidetes bacterium]|jgi:SOS-response transcriptional repressor LexA|nr:family transcriptional regulator [Bacteroidota bacterium]